MPDAAPHDADELPMKRGLSRVRSTIEAFAARVGGALFQALLLVVLARLTPIADFGSFGVSMAVGAVALGLLGLGLPTRALRIQPGDPGEIQTTAIRLSVATSALAAAIACVVGSLFLGLELAPVAAGAVAILAEGVVNVLQNVLFGLEELRRASVVMVIRRLLPLTGVGLAAIMAGGWDTDWIFLGAAGGSLAAVSACLLFLPQQQGRATVPIRKLIHESRHYWFSGVWSMGQQLDVVLVGALLGASPAAAFTAAFRLASPVHVITSVIVARLMPVVTKRRAEGLAWPTGFKPYLIAAAIYSGAILALLPFLPAIAVAVLGDSYRYAWWVFVLLFANSAISVMNQALAAWIFALDRLSHLVPRATAASTVTGLVFVALACVAGDLTLAAAGTLSIQILLLLFLAAIAFVERKYWRTA